MPELDTRLDHLLQQMNPVGLFEQSSTPKRPTCTILASPMIRLSHDPRTVIPESSHTGELAIRLALGNLTLDPSHQPALGQHLLGIISRVLGPLGIPLSPTRVDTQHALTFGLQNP